MPYRRASLLAIPIAIFLAGACSSAPENPPTAATPGSGADGGGMADGSGGTDGGAGTDATDPQPDSATPPAVTVTQETLASGGQTRKYLLVVPKTYDASKTYPLVLVLHGQPGESVSFHTYHPFEAASGQDAILAYPDGTNEEWNLYGASAGNKDMQYMRDLVTALAATYNIDTARVFADGYSNGAFFASQLACRFAGFLKGISLHAGGAPDEPNVNNPPKYPQNGCIQCTNGGPTATIVVHGLADATVVPGSGEYAATCWATTNQCGDTQSTSTPAPCKAYDGCPAGKDVKLCLVPGLGHLVWQNGAQAAWDFFKGLP